MLDKEKLIEFLNKSIEYHHGFSSHDFQSTLKYVFLNIDNGDFDVKENFDMKEITEFVESKYSELFTRQMKLEDKVSDLKNTITVNHDHNTLQRTYLKDEAIAYTNSLGESLESYDMSLLKRIQKLENIENQDLYAKLEDRVRKVEDKDLVKELLENVFKPEIVKSDSEISDLDRHSPDCVPFSCKCDEITDTERLDFIEQELCNISNYSLSINDSQKSTKWICTIIGKSSISNSTLRESIDAAMSSKDGN